MNLDRIGNITSELTSSLVRSIVLPGGILGWLSRPRGNRFRSSDGVVRPGAESATEAREALGLAAGPVLLLGGCPVPDEAIVHMMRFAGGRSARLAIVTVSAESPAPCNAEAVRLFSRYGMKNANLIEITDRSTADSKEVADSLAGAEAAILCCDDAAVGMALLKETECSHALVRMHVAGYLVAGLRAGASLLASELAMTAGNEVDVVSGLGLVPGLVVDTEFSSQARFARLVKAVNTEAGQARLGAGLDAGAALLIQGGEATVLGDGSVTFLDPRDTTALLEPALCPPGSVCGLKVHVLMEGFGMNLRSRRPFGRANELPVPAGEK